MALDPTTRKVDFELSIKKYFIYNLTILNNIVLFFENITDVPVNSSNVKLTKWIIITFGVRELGTVSEQFVSLDLFTRKDKEGYDLSTLTDLVLGYILNESSSTNNGLHIIPFYNVVPSTWVDVGGIIPYLQPLPQAFEGKDSTRIQNVTLRCKWGGK